MVAFSWSAMVITLVVWGCKDVVVSFQALLRRGAIEAANGTRASNISEYRLCERRTVCAGSWDSALAT